MSIDEYIRRYIQVKETKELISKIYDDTKEDLVKALRESDEPALYNDCIVEVVSSTRTSNNDEKLVKWIIDNNRKELLNIVYKPNMELINGVFYDTIPHEIIDSCIKSTNYDKIIFKKIKEE